MRWGKGGLWWLCEVLSAAEKAQRVLQVLEGWYGAATTEPRYRRLLT